MEDQHLVELVRLVVVLVLPRLFQELAWLHDLNNTSIGQPSCMLVSLVMRSIPWVGSSDSICEHLVCPTSASGTMSVSFK